MYYFQELNRNATRFYCVLFYIFYFLFLFARLKV